MSKIESAQILNRLIDKYENSKGWETGVFARAPQIDTKKELTEFCDPSKYRPYQEAAEELCEKAYISIKKTGKTISKIYLNTDKAEDIYRYLNRTSKKEKLRKVREVLEEYRNASDTCSEIYKAFAQSTKNRIADDPEELKKILYLISKIEQNEKETRIKDFSAGLKGGHSKLLTENNRQLLNKIINTMYQYGSYGSLLEEKEKEKILELNNIYNNPYIIRLRGSGVIITGQGKEIDIGALPGGIGILNEDVHIISRIQAKTLITVENETTFVGMPDTGKELFIWSAGFITKAIAELICKVNAEKYMHAGDIDVNGFFILDNIKMNTGKNFRPLKMDIETLKQCRQVKTLTDNDRKRLEGKTFQEEYRSVAKYMLEHNCKAEQETIYYRTDDYYEEK